MRDCVVVLKLADHLPDFTDVDYIGADKGALFLAKKKQRMVFSIGDFDSVTENERGWIELYSDEVIALNPVKNNSDSEAAVDEAIARGYRMIYIVGATGGRLDHEIVNIRLCWKYPDRVVLFDDKNYTRALGEGAHRVNRNGYQYFSMFAENECEISLNGFRYELDHRVLTEKDLYGLSNEIIGETGEIYVHRGSILTVQTND
ncbi:MAG: thiamine diphosphokinase [Solobacterium sp.]|nr:thiamine diphosphokinase [Solobacterium sp.]